MRLTLPLWTMYPLFGQFFRTLVRQGRRCGRRTSSQSRARNRYESCCSMIGAFGGEDRELDEFLGRLGLHPFPAEIVSVASM